MKISGVYIVKNEEHNLGRSIESIKAVCHELIVVDTGSTDNTVALAESFGAKVHHFKWRNDFAAARNFAIGHATGDVIIFLDADEWFATPLGEEAAAYIGGQVEQGMQAFYVRHQDVVDGRLSGTRHLTRIFRNRVGIHFVGAIHEQPAFNPDKGTTLPPEMFSIHHSGYDKQVISDKANRNILLLKQSLKKEKDPIKKWSGTIYLAREYKNQERMQEAKEYIDKAFSIQPKRAQNSDYNRVFSHLAHATRLEIAYGSGANDISDADYEKYVDEFLIVHPDHPVARLHKGYYEYLRRGNLGVAYDDLLKARHLNENFEKNQIRGDVISMDSYYISYWAAMADIEYTAGRFDLALESAIKSIKMGNFSPLNQLLHIIKEQNPSDVIAFLESILPHMTEERLVELLTQLKYFPNLKDVYTFYANRHIKMTSTFTDITLLVSLFGDSPDIGLATKVACEMLEDDEQTANVLLCAAMMISNDPVAYAPFGEKFGIGRILHSFYSNEPLAEVTRFESNVLLNAAPLVFFIDCGDTGDRLLNILSRWPMIKLMTATTFYSKAQMWQELFELADGMSLDYMDVDTIAQYFDIRAMACIGLKEYDKAIECYSNILSLTPGPDNTARDLRILAFLSPAHAEAVNRTLKLYIPRGVRPEKTEEADPVSTVKH